jgi:hypothetical protein
VLHAKISACNVKVHFFVTPALNCNSQFIKMPELKRQSQYFVTHNLKKIYNLNFLRVFSKRGTQISILTARLFILFYFRKRRFSCKNAFRVKTLFVYFSFFTRKAFLHEKRIYTKSVFTRKTA